MTTAEAMAIAKELCPGADLISVTPPADTIQWNKLAVGGEHEVKLTGQWTLIGEAFGDLIFANAVSPGDALRGFQSKYDALATKPEACDLCGGTKLRQGLPGDLGDVPCPICARKEQQC